MNRTLLFLAIATMLIAMFGCSGSIQNPVSTGMEANAPSTTDQNAAQFDATPGHSLMGYFDVLVDPQTYKVEFIPLRTTELHFNMVGVLEGGVSNISLDGPISVNNGILSANIKLNHPFSGKPQLSGFDVKGILISKGSEAGFSDTDIRIAGPNETRLLNPDGFTRWWNPAEFLGSGIVGYKQGKMGTSMDPSTVSILNGYKLFADGFGANAVLNDLDQNNRALFTAGSSNTRNFQISLASGLKFNYAVDCSWAAPTVNPPVNLPEDFPLEANQSEPWFINVDETLNTLWYAGGNHGGNISYEITVYDWQGADGIGTIHVEAPGVFSFTSSTPDTTGTNSKSYHFDSVLPDLTSNTDIDVLVTVETDGDYSPSLTGVDKPLRSYQRHITPVADTEPIFNEPPHAVMNATSETEIYTDQSVSFDASGSYDTDGFIDQYKWDFNADGVYGDSFDSGTADKPTKIFTNAGSFPVKVRVYDDKGATNTSAPVQVLVTLYTNDPPVAAAVATTPTTIDEDNTISFDASGSTDVDGTIVDYQWDFDGDGVFGDAFTGNMVTPTAMFPNPGDYQVDLKVIDNDNGTDKLDSKITVHIIDVPNVLPTASAIATTSTQINLCDTVTFDASASTDTDGTIASYQWDFNGDGTYGDSYLSGTDVNPVAGYDATGTFNAQLKVIDNEGGEDTLDASIMVVVTNGTPVADAVATTPTDIFSGDSITFDASASYDPNESCGDTITFQWDFDGDGTFGDTYELGTDENPTKTFATVGDFEVNLKVVDNFGGEDQLSEPIHVNVTNKPPTACAQITDGTPYFWHTDIHFSGSCSTDTDGLIEDYEWDLGADGSYEKTGMDVTFNFDTAGQYTMQLRVTDNEGASSLLDTPLTFNIFDDTNTPPVVNAVIHSRTTSYIASVAEAVSLSVDFTDIAPPGDTHTYLWTCPYGTFDDATSPTPVWTPPNQVVKCQITCQVTDSLGFSDSGSCDQWVTNYSVIPGNSQGMMPSASLHSFIPDLTLTLPTDVMGKVCYMNFWGVWCGPCVAEMPALQTMYDLYSSNPDFVRLQVGVNETEATEIAFINANGYTATYWVVSNAYYSACQQFANPPGYVPTHELFDRDGRCRWQQVGGFSGGTGPLETVINQLL